VIPTPALDRIANNGLRFSNFNSTALCSSTRAALNEQVHVANFLDPLRRSVMWRMRAVRNVINGRNHHSVGLGVISEPATGYPGYNSIIPKDKATIGRVLQENGYSTSWFGKNHNTPAFATSAAGPFDQWPSEMGFEYFYGFVGGDANQWQPNLFRNTTAIYPYGSVKSCLYVGGGSTCSKI
jgi:arylsulfatase A-like enzyme